MSLTISDQGLFDTDLQEPLNLFLGSGFSTLARNCNHNLLTGSALKDALIAEFDLQNMATLTLSQIYSLCESEDSKRLRDFIDSEFTVSSFPKEYDVLRALNVSQIYTTNVDDLAFHIFGPRDGTVSKAVHDTYVNGAPKIASDVIQYTALHGSVRYEDRPLVFTDGQIASAFASDQETWYVFQRELGSRPTIFIGYSLSDAGVLQALHGARQGSGRRWLLLREPDHAHVTLYENLGYKTIVGDTEGLLAYLKGLNLSRRIPNTARPVSRIGAIPIATEIAQRPVKNFFMGAEPSWSDAYSSQIVRRRVNDTAQSLLFQGKNVALVGLPLSGKSTILRQVAVDVASRRFAVFFDRLDVALAHEIIAEYKDTKETPIIFLDNLIDSRDAIKVLEQSREFQIAACETSFYFDSLNLQGLRAKFNVIPCSEVNSADLQKIISSIPGSIRRRAQEQMEVLPVDTESLGLFEAIERNVLDENLKNRYRTRLVEFEKSNRAAFDVFIMACYVGQCRTVVSFDMIYLFVEGKKDYKSVYEIISVIKDFLEEVEDTTLADMDYFSVRSSALARLAISLISKTAFGRVYERFSAAVNPRTIPDFATFRRYAYDNDFALKAFPDVERGKAFYTRLLANSDNAYDYQHAAIYMSKMGRFKEAFDWIDKAMSMSKRYMYPIRNSHAVILFEANIGVFRANPSDRTAADGLAESMDVLESCLNEDNRRSYHLLRFADQAVQLSEISRSKTTRHWLDIADAKLKEALTAAMKVGSRESYNAHKFRRLISQVDQARLT